jgi:hypothetical protein
LGIGDAPQVAAQLSMLDKNEKGGFLDCSSIEQERAIAASLSSKAWV